MKPLTLTEKLRLLGYDWFGAEPPEAVLHDAVDDLAAGILGVRDGDPGACARPPDWDRLEAMPHPRTLEAALEECLQQTAWDAEEAQMARDREE